MSETKNKAYALLRKFERDVVALGGCVTMAYVHGADDGKEEEEGDAVLVVPGLSRVLEDLGIMLLAQKHALVRDDQTLARLMALTRVVLDAEDLVLVARDRHGRLFVDATPGSRLMDELKVDRR